VQIVRGKHAKEAVAKVTTVYRRRYCIHVDRIIKEKTNGAQVPVPIHPSKVQITKLKLDKDRKALIERKKVSAPPFTASAPFPAHALRPLFLCPVSLCYRISAPSGSCVSRGVTVHDSQPSSCAVSGGGGGPEVVLSAWVGGLSARMCWRTREKVGFDEHVTAGERLRVVLLVGLHIASWRRVWH